MKPFLLSSFVIAEILLSIFALFTIFKKNFMVSTEAYCYSVILIFAVYSLSIQIFFVLNLQKFYYLFDICVVILSSYQIWKGKQFIFTTIQELIQFCKDYKTIPLLIISVWGYLFLQVLLLPPMNWDSMTYNLARVLMFQEEGSLFLKNFTHYAQVTYPWGYDILSFLILRFYSDYGLSIFSFLSYTVVVLGTYGLVNRIFNNPSLSLTSCFIIASLKEIVLQATTTKNDIPLAAISVVCFLAGYNFYQSLKFKYFYFIIVALTFGLSVKGYFSAFLLPFSFFYLFLLLKELPFNKVMSSSLSTTKSEKLWLILPLGLILCLMLNWGNNFIHYGNIFGEKRYITNELNQHGVLGGLINILRYLSQCIDPPFQWVKDILTGIHDKILGDYQFIACKPVFPFNLDWTNAPDERFSWYGPLGFFLIIPALLYSFCRGKGFIRVISISLLTFWLIICYKIIWRPANGRFFSLFFAGSGVCVAFLLQRFSEHKFLKLIILIIASATLLYTSLFNAQKPFTTLNTMATFSKEVIGLDTHSLKERFLHPGALVFNWVYYVKNRTAFYDMRFKSKVVMNTFVNSIESGNRVLLLADSYSWIFPFLFKRPDLIITVARPDHICLGGKIYNINVYKDYLSLKKKFDYLLCCEVGLTEIVSNSLQKEKRLFYVPPTTFRRDPISLYEFKWSGEVSS